MFTTQLYSFLCDYDAIVSYIDKKEAFRQEYPQIPIGLLPSAVSLEYTILCIMEDV